VLPHAGLVPNRRVWDCNVCKPKTVSDVCDVEYEGQELGLELQHTRAITVHKARQCGCHLVVTRWKGTLFLVVQLLSEMLPHALQGLAGLAYSRQL
jgi:hypothetical protein